MASSFSLAKGNNMKIVFVLFLAVIVFVLFVVNSQNDHISLNNLASNHIENENTAPDSKTNQIDTAKLQITEIEKHNTSLIQTKKTTCLNLCEEVLNTLTLGYSLSAKQLEYINNNPLVIIDNLIHSPEAIAVLITFGFENDDNTENTLGSLVAEKLKANLSYEQQIYLADALFESSNKPEKLVALDLMTNIIKIESSDLTNFNRILNEETDSEILVRAINLTKQTKGEKNTLFVMSGLTDIIHGGHSPHITGTALLAKAALSPSPSHIYRDVLDAAYSYSDETKEFGLSVIASVLEQDATSDENSSGWQTDANLQQVIESIADNAETDMKTRRMALNLMDSYY